MGYAFVIHFILILALEWPYVLGHGRLVEPPSRSSMWRFGFKTKRNYNDNELFCGGYTVQWQRNGGKCGVCGDAWHLPKPRPNEAGGAYGQGIIVRNYARGQLITSRVEITANHKGFFEFKLCPHNNPTSEVTQDCLDRYPLQMADGSGTKYFVAPGTGPFDVQLKLPKQVTCSQCVFQWTYTAGNNWGRCENGSSKVGCGPQETFRGCADVAIGDSEGNSIPMYNNNDADFGPSISAIPPKNPTKPKPKPRPPSQTGKRQQTRPWRRPYNERRRPTPRPNTTRRPSAKKPTTHRRQQRPTSWATQLKRFTTSTTTKAPPVTRWYQYRPGYPSKRRYPPTRRTTAWSTYTERPTLRKQQVTKKPRPTRKPKPVNTRKSYTTESEGSDGGNCKAVGVWKNVPGIASWCDVNCPRGYCPATHCDCSRK